MHYNEKSECYEIEIKGITFVSEEEQNAEYISKLNVIAENYYNNLKGIIEFMMSDLKEMYGTDSSETIKENLGRPIIDYDNGTVTYLEQTFDNIHIFSFDFLDDDFQEIQYFAIDG